MWKTAFKTISPYIFLRLAFKNFLGSFLNTLSQIKNIRGVYRTLANISDGAFSLQNNKWQNPKYASVYYIFKKITLIHAQVLLTAIFTPLIFFIGENFSHVNENEGSSSNLDVSGLLVLSGIKIFNKQQKSRKDKSFTSFAIRDKNFMQV